MSLPRFKNGQEPLIDRMDETGHSLERGGKCHGVAYKGMFAILGETLDQFDHLLAYIYDELPETSVSLQELQQLFRREESFLDGVKLFQDPQAHPEVFSVTPSRINQVYAPDLLVPLMTPVDLEKQGGVVKLFDSTGATSIDELQDYFQQLKQIIDKQQAQDPIAFIISSSKHTISVGYQPKSGKWVMINANTLPSEIIEPENIGNKVAKCLLSSSTHISCRIIGYAKKNSLQLYKTCIKQWKETKIWHAMHEPTTKTCNLKNDHGTSWLHTAASEGKIDQVIKLLNKGAEIDAQDKDGWTPLKCASSYGCTEIVRILLEHGADPSICDTKGWPPFLNAALEGQTEVMQLLAKHNPKTVNHQDKNGFTALFAAAQIGDVSAVRLLMKLDANPKLCFMQTGEKFIDFGKDEEKEEEVQKFLFDQHTSHTHSQEIKATDGVLNWSLSNRIHTNSQPQKPIMYQMTPRDIAKIMGHEEIYELLDTYELKSKSSMVL